MFLPKKNGTKQASPLRYKRSRMQKERKKQEEETR